MSKESTRHFLVIATQCRSERPLVQLDTAARALHTTLTAPGVSAATGAVLVDPAEKSRVEAAVEQAVSHAGAQNAVLIIAFLGHGFTSGRNLYYMAHNTVRDHPASGVEIGRLLTEAALQPGIGGVIGLIDTCHAAGGLPDMSAVVGGTGRIGLEVLLASAVDQLAYRMDFTFALTSLLNEGIADAADKIYVDGKLVNRLKKMVPSQTPACLNYNGGTATQLWLAHNRAKSIGTTIGSVGAVGNEELAAAVTAWDGAFPIPATWTPRSLQDLWEKGNQRVRDTVDGVRHAMHAAEFVRDHLGEKLSTPEMRAAARRAGLPRTPASSGSPLLVTLLECAALRAARIGRSRWEPLAKFVCALVMATKSPFDGPGLRQWAKTRGLQFEINDAMQALTAAPERTDLRLVLSLADGLTSWPDTVYAWVLRHGETPTPQASFDCARNDRPSTEDAVHRALEWVLRDVVQPGEHLGHVDVAAPAHLLAEWCPEETRAGLYLLGSRRDVLTQWSGRMEPSLVQSNEYARSALREIEDHVGVPVDWVTRKDLGDLHSFRTKLLGGPFRRAIGLDHRPSNLVDVLEMLLPYSPILFWPGPQADIEGTWVGAVEDSWADLPQGFADAFRDRLDGKTAVLSFVRAAWHDAGWLEFCRQFEQRSVRSPESKPSNPESES
ncbi:hypothetical protein [Amycolatopsis sp. lyj-90]|uniref:vWA-MoxR associated conflict system protein n=1 Tax=Amycolatopsis sp. lyj-90 TaxID=2789285 RepID=UPI003979904C